MILGFTTGAVFNIVMCLVCRCLDSSKGLPARILERLLRLPSLFYCKFGDVDDKESVKEASTALHEIMSGVSSNCDSGQ